MVDYFLEDRTRLEGQPKMTIGNYVEQNGIRVPRRFSSFAEARKSGVEIICRSEHPQEYDGVSGLIESPILQELGGIGTKDDLKRKVLDEDKISNWVRAYCDFVGLDQSVFREEITFSFWEKLAGYNRTVVADSSIKGRYHITTWTEGNKIVNGTIFENGEVVSQNTALPTELEEGIPELIGLYERIRHLGKFDSNHCPIMEFQTVDGNNYFLQYHRTRDFSPASFELDQEPDKDTIVASFTRGSTKPDGTLIKTIVCDPVLYEMTKDGVSFIPPKDEGYFVRTDWLVYNELLARDRNFYMRVAHSLDETLYSLALGHVSRSITFKPELSVFVGTDSNFATPEEAERLWDRMGETGEFQYINLHVVADGRKSHIKRVD